MDDYSVYNIAEAGHIQHMNYKWQLFQGINQVIIKWWSMNTVGYSEWL